MTYRLSDPMLAECAASGQMDASQVHQHARAGELPITFEGPEPTLPLSGDFTVVPNALHRLERELATEAARSDVECFAASVPSNHSMPVYDITRLDPELPQDDDMQQDYEAVIAKAVRYLDMLGLLVRPVTGNPNFISFRAERQ